MGRNIDTHKIHCGINWIEVVAHDEPNELTGANYDYSISAYDNNSSEGMMNVPSYTVNIIFQQGNLKDVGVNGIIDDCLLAIIIDRFKGFNRGEFACRETALAITKLEEVIDVLGRRKREREARGVLGTYNK